MEEVMTAGFKKYSDKECSGNLNAIGDALYAIGGKWKLRLIVALMEGSRRFNEIQRTVVGISAKVLSKELKELEMNGFIRKIEHKGSLVTTSYELTSYSHSLNPVIEALNRWGRQHRKKIIGKE